MDRRCRHRTAQLRVFMPLVALVVVHLLSARCDEPVGRDTQAALPGPNQITIDQFDLDPMGSEAAYAGYVVDDLTGRPISPFQITVRHRVGMIRFDGRGDDEVGVFRIRGDRVGRKHQIIVYADGYEPLPKTIAAVDSNEESTLSLWRLKRSLSLRGSLVDHEGMPIDGAEVLCGIMDADARGVGFARSTFYQYADGNRELKFVQRTTTGPDGTFLFSQGQTKPGLIIKAPGYAWKLIYPEELTSCEQDGVLRIPMHTESIIAGTVTLDGEPVCNARVGATSTADSRLMFDSTDVDAQGEFRLDGFEPGVYRLHVRLTSEKGALYRFSQAIELPSTGALKLNYRTGPLTVTGKAKPLASVRAMTARDAAQKHRYHLPSISTTAAPDGTFELSGLFPGTYTIESGGDSWHGPVAKTIAVTRPMDIDLTEPPMTVLVVPKNR